MGKDIGTRCRHGERLGIWRGYWDLNIKPKHQVLQPDPRTGSAYLQGSTQSPSNFSLYCFLQGLIPSPCSEPMKTQLGPYSSTGYFSLPCGPRHKYLLRIHMLLLLGPQATTWTYYDAPQEYPGLWGPKLPPALRVKESCLAGHGTAPWNQQLLATQALSSRLPQALLSLYR